MGSQRRSLSGLKASRAAHAAAVHSNRLSLGSCPSGAKSIYSTPAQEELFLDRFSTPRVSFHSVYSQPAQEEDLLSRSSAPRVSFHSVHSQPAQEREAVERSALPRLHRMPGPDAYYHVTEPTSQDSWAQTYPEALHRRSSQGSRRSASHPRPADAHTHQSAGLVHQPGTAHFFYPNLLQRRSSQSSRPFTAPMHTPEAVHQQPGLQQHSSLPPGLPPHGRGQLQGQQQTMHTPRDQSRSTFSSQGLQGQPQRQPHSQSPGQSQGQPQNAPSGSHRSDPSAAQWMTANSPPRAQLAALSDLYQPSSPSNTGVLHQANSLPQQQHQRHSKQEYQQQQQQQHQHQHQHQHHQLRPQLQSQAQQQQLAARPQQHPAMLPVSAAYMNGFQNGFATGFQHGTPPMLQHSNGMHSQTGDMLVHQLLV